MLLSDEEVATRLTSPINLLNRLRNRSHEKARIVSVPSVTDLVENLDDKISAKSNSAKAADILSEVLDNLKGNTDGIKPEKLAAVAERLARVVSSEVHKPIAIQNNQVIVYAPQIMKEEDFEVLDVVAE